MEAAPLVLAHNHARNALLEVSKSNTIAASEEHDLAAGEFASAASTTADAEATRILKLLEQHHQKLAEILKIKPDDRASTNAISSSTDAASPAEEPSTSQEQSKTVDLHARPASLQSTAHGHRNMTSSIAQDLASARGIAARPRRSQHSMPQISSQNAEGRMLKPARRSNLGEHEMRTADISEKNDRNPDSSSKSTTRNSNASGLGTVLPRPITTATADDPFQRFYSTFGNLITTLSAPLAFAGLPLNTDAPSTAVAPSKPTSPAESRVSADPELHRFFSKAALRAVRDEHGGFNPNESFYVVPTSGGTMSYAGMLANTRQNSSLTEEDEAEFVDASETPQPPSPGLVGARPARTGNGPKIHGYKDNKTWEEMMVENETLKAVALDLGERLRAFELNAQRSSRALHASVRGLSSPTGSVIGSGGAPPMPGTEGIKILQNKLQDNEEELKALRKENKRLSRENTKFMSVIERYRERWEVLKEGARDRVKGDTQRRASEAGVQAQSP